MRGKKGIEHFDPSDPPRCRANKRCGRGTRANDRPPVLGTIGRETGQVRLRVVSDTRQTTLRKHVEHFTGEGSHVYTDEYDSHATLNRSHSTVYHGRKEWARDDDGDGLREVHTNTTEGMWWACGHSRVSFTASVSIFSVVMWRFMNFGSVSSMFPSYASLL